MLASLFAIRPMRISVLSAVIVISAFVLPAFAQDNAEGERAAASPPRFELKTEDYWLLNLPNGQRFDASGLIRLPNGDFWTVNDQVAGIYRIVFSDKPNTADLEHIPAVFRPATGGGGGGGSGGGGSGGGQPPSRLDCEGLTLDSAGRLYISEESRRWILRWDPATETLGRLPLDWSPVSSHFHPTDRNASFEGIAIDGSRLYVANEREKARILVVDLDRRALVDDFAVLPTDALGDDAHYSDLAWHDGSLWVLVRDMRRVLRVDPAARRIVAEFDYASVETQRSVAYGSFIAPGFMEGIWVDDRHIWLISDNNGFGRRVDANDRRPVMFRCARPDVAAQAPGDRTDP